MDTFNTLSRHLRDRRIPKYHSSHFINEEHSSKHSRLPHIHDDFMELFFVYEGSGKYMVDNTYYDVETGDIVICNAGVIHGENPDDPTRKIRSYCVGISNVSFLELPDNHICGEDTNPVLKAGMLSRSIGELFRLIYVYSADEKHFGEVCNALTAGLLLMVYEMILSRERNMPADTPGDSYFSAKRIREFLDTHYREEVTLADVSKALHISEYYLAHLFKDEYGISPIKYVMKRRIGEAQGLLMDTSVPIGDIADYLGFSSVSHFNSMFKKYVGIPPGAYRQSMIDMKE